MKRNNTLWMAVLMVFAISLKWLVARHFGYLERGMEGIILEVLLIPIVYVIGITITKREESSLFAALLASTIPIYNWKAGAGVTNTLTAVLFFVIVVMFLNIRKIDWRYGLPIVLLFAASSFYTLFLIPIFVIYYLLSKFEGASLTKTEKKFMFEAGFLVILVFIFLLYGPNITLIFKQYLDTHYLSIGAGELTLENLLSRAGSLAIVYGLLGMYSGFKNKLKPVFFLSSIMAIFTLLMFFNFFDLGYGLSYFNLSSACLASIWYSNLEKRIKYTRLSKHKNIIKLLVIALVIVYGSLTYLSAVR